MSKKKKPKFSSGSGSDLVCSGECGKPVKVNGQIVIITHRSSRGHIEWQQYWHTTCRLAVLTKEKGRV